MTLCSALNQDAEHVMCVFQDLTATRSRLLCFLMSDLVSPTSHQRSRSARVNCGHRAHDNSFALLVSVLLCLCVFLATCSCVFSHSITHVVCYCLAVMINFGVGTCPHWSPLHAGPLVVGSCVLVCYRKWQGLLACNPLQGSRNI